MRRIGLALSGGGFRATLFHLGMVRALREHRFRDSNKRLIDCVTHISSVSGGSVLAAHMGLNWSKYVGNDQEFEKAAKEIVDFISTDVRGDIVRAIPVLMLRRFVCIIAFAFVRWLPLIRLKERVAFTLEKATTTYLLEKHFMRLYGKETGLAELSRWKGQLNCPEIYLLGTNVTDVGLCAFTSRGFERDSLRPDAHKRFGDKFITIAEAVTASAAFPALFPPVNLNREGFVTSSEEFLFVTDAGVYDNSGISRLLALSESEMPQIMLVSDATGQVEWSQHRRVNLLSNALRTVDIIHQRSSKLQKQLVSFPIDGKHLPGDVQTIFVDISEDQLSERNAPHLPLDCQRWLKFIRTDFDHFDPIEAQYLIDHGYCVCFKALSEMLVDSIFTTRQNHNAGEDFSHCPSGGHKEKDASHDVKILKRGTRRSPRLFSWADGDSRLHLTLVAILISGSIYYLAKQLQSPPKPSLSQALIDRNTYSNNWIAITHNFDAATQHLESLAREKADLDSKISSYESQSDNAKESMSNLNATLIQFTNNYMKVASALTTANNILASYKTKMGQSNLELATNRDEIINYSNQITQLQKALSTAQESSSTQSNELGDLFRQVFALNQNVATQESQLRQVLGALLRDYSHAQTTPLTNLSLQISKAPAESANYDNYIFHSVERVFDLRRWVKVGPTNSGEYVEPCVCETRFLLERTGSEDDEPGFQIPFETSGVGLFPSVPTPYSENAELRVAKPQMNSTLKRCYRLLVDLADAPVDKPFELNCGATYWNAFQNSNQWWAGVKILGQTEHASIAVIFPEGKVPQSIDIVTSTNAGGREWQMVGNEFVFYTNHNVAYVEFEGGILKPNCSYGLRWRW